MAAPDGSCSSTATSLILQPWRPFFINDKNFLVKSYFSELSDAYEICICDFDKIWLEKLDQDTIKTRSKELNPNIEADVMYIVKHLQKNMEEQHELSQYHAQEEENGEKLVLCLKTKLQPGVPFAWDFQCNLAPENMMSFSIIEPLVDMIAELQRRQTELQNLLKKKDLEISDYKESGVKLSNRRLETKTFDEDAFKNKMFLSAGFSQTVARSKKLAFTEGLQELYKQVMLKRAWLQDKSMRGELPELDCLLETASGLGAPSSLFSDSSPNISPQVSPKKTPVTSPEKSSKENSPSKDLELQRREELRRKLAEEEERKKRKKKKIKL